MKKSVSQKAAQIANDEALRQTEMAVLLAHEQAKIANDIILSQNRAAKSKVKAIEEEARAQVILAAEHVQAQKDQAVKERDGLWKSYAKTKKFLWSRPA